MSTSGECEVCHMLGVTCTHDGAPNGGGLHEFQFFGTGGANSWLVDGPGYGPEYGLGFGGAAEETLTAAAEPSFKYMDFLRNACEPGRLALDVPSSSVPTASSDSASWSPPRPSAPTSMISFSGNNSFSSSPEWNAKEADKTEIDGETIVMDREARVMRYREKKKRRKFEKQIRYASRKAYAEMRPRVKGRFAKVSSESQVTQVPSMPTSFILGQQHDMGIRWYQP